MSGSGNATNESERKSGDEPDPRTAERPQARARSALLLEQIPLVALAVLILATTLLSNRFLSSSNITNILVQSSVMSVVAMGMTYVITVGGFDLSVGSTVALSGCVSTWVMLHTNVAVGVLLGVASGALVGLVNGTVVTRLKVSPFITTLGTMAVVRGAALLMTEGRPVVGDEGLPEAFLALGRGSLFGVYYLIWLPLVLFVAFAWLLHKTAYGQRIFATGGNPHAAFLCGIGISRVTASAYVWCGALAGVAGVMLAARLQSGQPTAGEFYELTAIAAVVLGGASLHGGEGKLYKSMIGVLIMVVLGNGLNLLNVHSYWQRVVIGAVIILAAAGGQLRSRD